MPNRFQQFEAIARALAELPKQEPTTEPVAEKPALHPFEIRNIHPALPPKVKVLFDDGHCAEATELAFKYLDKKIQKLSLIGKSGFQLMMDAFDGSSPKIRLNPLITISDKDEQNGFRFMFAGAMQGIRNPRAHEFAVIDDPDTCLDHLSFVSMLLRTLEHAGYK